MDTCGRLVAALLPQVPGQGTRQAWGAAALCAGRTLSAVSNSAVAEALFLLCRAASPASTATVVPSASAANPKGLSAAAGFAYTDPGIGRGRRPSAGPLPAAPSVSVLRPAFSGPASAAAIFKPLEALPGEWYPADDAAAHEWAESSDAGTSSSAVSRPSSSAEVHARSSLPQPGATLSEGRSTAATAPAGAAPQGGAGPGEPLSHLRVLVIDDEQVNTMLISRILGRHKRVEVTVGADGTDLVDLVCGQGREFECVLLDQCVRLCSLQETEL